MKKIVHWMLVLGALALPFMTPASAISIQNVRDDAPYELSSTEQCIDVHRLRGTHTVMDGLGDVLTNLLVGDYEADIDSENGRHLVIAMSVADYTKVAWTSIVIEGIDRINLHSAAFDGVSVLSVDVETVDEREDSDGNFEPYVKQSTLIINLTSAIKKLAASTGGNTDETDRYVPTSVRVAVR